MKFGKFYKRAEEAKDRLRPGEVKRYDKEMVSGFQIRIDI